MRETEAIKKALEAARKQGRVIVERGHKVTILDDVPVMLVPLGASEKELQTWVLKWAGNYGWLCYHTHRSDRSQPGYPDLTLVNKTLLIIELKTEKGEVTDEQQQWLDALQGAGVEAAVWRPHMAEEILERLRRG